MHLRVVRRSVYYIVYRISSSTIAIRLISFDTNGELLDDYET